jgi:hypothetical protein
MTQPSGRFHRCTCLCPSPGCELELEAWLGSAPLHGNLLYDQETVPDDRPHQRRHGTNLSSASWGFRAS